MSNAPIFHIDPQAFWIDPYPTLAKMRRDAPIAYVPELDATLLTRRDDIFCEEKRIEVFSSEQPGGLMTTLMGENMMRKDGAAHLAERKMIFPTVSPRTVRDVWKTQFESTTSKILDQLAPIQTADLVSDFAMPASAEALKAITGLTNMHFAEMDRVSQGMIDGVGNYAGDPQVEANCHDCTASIDAHIDAQIPVLKANPDMSLLSVSMNAGMPEQQIRANIKLAISGGQNEPRDAIAGTIATLIGHPDQLDKALNGEVTWLQVFEEYARWMSPIGMSPRRIAKHYTLNDITFEPEDRAFLMFASGNRDETIFINPDTFDVTRDNTKAISFGAGPHFCAGAWASRCMIADVALPMFFARFPNPTLTEPVAYRGWAFRGPLSVEAADLVQ
ncbi:MAG: cytochrome P450 [Planktotalea sp.]|jgi:cytochrome P450|uniref:cytochrome P450 n=1 Tax=Planktotalea sp. TaxID=2029877 RepID=UPI00018398ED|nr:cytochrome P450 [Planktotalea sp.]EDZ43821.1 cytochrome P450-pinF2, plant-inducible, putative [Rhodobacteraceae bacterium HTCC2083]MDG1075468.1 cytochrome P450 [Planktotalea sp.]HCW85543.1 cytochrome P450 [Paracoccaceae bacterium]